MSKLPADCLNDIFEYLEDDNVTLYSCILVNRLWCEVSVRIFWRSIWNYNNRSYNKLINTISSLMTKLPNTLIKLYLYGEYDISLSFIAKLTNLQELELSFYYNENFKDFEILQYAIFPHLQILKIRYACPIYGLLIKFLENNGKNIKEFYIGDFK